MQRVCSRARPRFLAENSRMNARRRNLFHLILVGLSLAAMQSVLADENKTVMGPSNIFLYDGANALMAGDGESGVRLTLQGLEHAQGLREKRIGHSNLCAGFLLINEPEQALEHCNWVLQRDSKHWRTYNNRALVYMRLERYTEAEEDIRKGQELRPNSRKLKIVKGMYLDETQPVTPNVEVDDRRDTTEKIGNASDADSGD